MRSIRIAAATSVLVLAAACGGDGGGTPPPDNRPPVAGFSEVCTQLSCVFTDASTDPDGNTTITGRAWTFGDQASSNETNPTHAYAAEGTYVVSLTVTDDASATNTFTKNVTVTAAPPANQPPTAGFTVTCNGADCSFTNTSTDLDGTITTNAWDFGEPSSGANNTSSAQNPAHTYTVTAVTPFTVTLTVTDDDGATATSSQTITVTPPATLQCDNGATVVNCTLDITQTATVKMTLTSRDCELGGNRFAVTQPIRQTIFFNGCSQPIGTEYILRDPTGAPMVFQAGTHIQTQFTQGVGDPDDPPRGAPAIRLEGTFPSWTINIDDGGNPTGAGEPDFNDIVLTVTATPQ